MSLYIGNTENSVHMISGKTDYRDFRYAFADKGYVSTTEPNNPQENDMWINSSSMPTTFPVTNVKIYKDGAWRTVTAYAPLMYDTWTYYSTNTGYLNYYWDSHANKWLLLDDTSKYLKLTGGTLTGKVDSTFESSTWINGVSNAILNGKYSGYGALISAPVKDGRVSISTYPSSDNILYFGYASSGQISTGANSFTKQMLWNVTENSLTASTFIGSLSGNATTASSTNKITNKGTNTITSTANDTTSNWGAQGTSVHWYTATGQLKDQPGQWGYVLNVGSGTEVHQIWMTQASGSLLHRGGNASGWSGSWRTILDSSNYTSIVTPANIGAATSGHTHSQYAASSHTHSYLPLSGGTVSGNLAVTGTTQSQGHRIFIQASAPSSPSTNDIWIDI